MAIYMGLKTAICCISVTTADIHSTTVSKNDKLNIDIPAIDRVLKLVDKTRLNPELLLTNDLSESVQV